MQADVLTYKQNYIIHACVQLCMWCVLVMTCVNTHGCTCICTCTRAHGCVHTHAYLWVCVQLLWYMYAWNAQCIHTSCIHMSCIIHIHILHSHDMHIHHECTNHAYTHCTQLRMITFVSWLVYFFLSACTLFTCSVIFPCHDHTCYGMLKQKYTESEQYEQICMHVHAH